MFQITPMVKRLLIVNVIIFAFGDFFPNLLNNMVLSLDGLAKLRIYELITYQFLHGNFSHILGNMILLFFFGPELERRWGSQNYIIAYIVAGIVAGLAEVLITPDAAIIGASGSVMAVFTAYALYYPNREILLYFFIPLKIKYLFLFYLMSDLIGILPSSNDSIAHFAHLGGVLVGYSFVHYFEKNGVSKSWGASPRKPQQTADIFSKMKDAFQSVQSKPKPFQTHSRSESYDRDKLHFYRSEVDALLDKINQVGYLKLSDDERKRLEDASAYLKKFDSH